MPSPSSSTQTRRELCLALASAGIARLGEQSPAHGVAGDSSLLEKIASFTREERIVFQGDAKDIQHTAKAVLIGEAKSGKSALLARYFYGRFTPLYEATIGLDFNQVALRTPPSGDVVRLQVYDLSGSERFDAITTSYFRSANAGVFVYDVTNPCALEKLDPLIKEFSEENDSSHTLKILVGNKYDMDDPQISLAQARQFARDHEFNSVFQTSAKDDINVEELFNSVANHTGNLVAPPRDGVV